MIQVDILQIQKCTAGYCTHTRTHARTRARARTDWGGGGGGGRGGGGIICRFEEMSF